MTSLSIAGTFEANTSSPFVIFNASIVNNTIAKSIPAYTSFIRATVDGITTEITEIVVSTYNFTIAYFFFGGNTSWVEGFNIKTTEKCQ